MGPHEPPGPCEKAPAGARLADLSAREADIAHGVAAGRANTDIAAQFGISVKTVETHLSRIYARLGFRSRAQLAAYVSGGAREKDVRARD